MRNIHRLATKLANILACLLMIVALVVPGSVHADEIECGSLQNANGVFDYRDQSSEGKARLQLVNANHFTTDVQTLTKGNTGALWADLDFVLRVFPNHRDALYTMINYYTDSQAAWRPPMPRSAECYLDRATRFQPNDETVWMLSGLLLSRQGRPSEAISALKHADELNPDNPEVHYNLGLLYVKAKDYDNALTQARLAYKGRYPLMGLKKELQRLGVWSEE